MKNLVSKLYLAIIPIVLALLLNLGGNNSIAQAKKAVEKPQVAPINLLDYQQQPGMVKIFMANTEGAPTFLGIINLKQELKDNRINFYQAVWVMDKQGQFIKYPLVVKKFIGTPEELQGVLLDKYGNMPYRQHLVSVETNSLQPVPFTSDDTNTMKLLGEETINTPAGDYPCIAIEIYNPKTKEGVIQYLAKGLGVIRLEGIDKEGNKLTMADLVGTRILTSEELAKVQQTKIVDNSL